MGGLHQGIGKEFNALSDRLKELFSGTASIDTYSNKAETSTSTGFAKLYYHKRSIYSELVEKWLASEQSNGKLSKDDYSLLLEFINENFDEHGMMFRKDRPQLPVYEAFKEEGVKLSWPLQDAYFVKQDALFKDEEVFERPASSSGKVVDDSDNLVLEYHIVKHPDFQESISTEAYRLEYSAKEAKRTKNDAGGWTVQVFIEVKKEAASRSNEGSKDAYFDGLEKDLMSLELTSTKTVGDYFKISSSEVKTLIKAHRDKSDIGCFLPKNYTDTLLRHWKAFCSAQIMDENKAFSDEGIEDRFIARIRYLEQAGERLFTSIAQVGEELVSMWEAPKLSHSTEFVIPVGLLLGSQKDADDISTIKELINEEHNGGRPWNDLVDFLMEPLASEGNNKFTLLPEGVYYTHLEINGQKNNSIDDIVAVLREHPEIPIYTRFFGGTGLSKIFYAYQLIDKAMENYARIHGLNRGDVTIYNVMEQECYKSDNWQALNTLKERYGGKVDVIYIDPPYNTEGDMFTYQDGMNEPSWMTMMKDRLELGKDMLNDEGTMFISCDDNEQAVLKLLCDKVLGKKHYVASIPRMTSPQRANQEQYVSTTHDYVIVYSWRADFEKISMKDNINLDEVKEDNNGHYIPGDTNPIVASKGKGYVKSLDFDYEYEGVVYKPMTRRGRNRWLWSKERFDAAAKLGILRPTGSGGLRAQNYLDVSFEDKGPNKNTMVPKKGLRFDTLDLIPKEQQDSLEALYRKTQYTNTEGTSILNDTLNGDYDAIKPKPVELIKLLIRLSTDKTDALVMDYFIGSGTTFHAVAELNNEDEGQRRCVGVDQNTYIDTITVPRIVKVYQDIALSKPLEDDERLKSLRVIGRSELVQFRELLNLISAGEELYSNEHGHGSDDNGAVIKVNKNEEEYNQPKFCYDPKLACLLNVETGELDERADSFKWCCQNLAGIPGAPPIVFDFIWSYMNATGYAFSGMNYGQAEFNTMEGAGSGFQRVSLPDTEGSSDEDAWTTVGDVLKRMLYWGGGL